MKIYEYYQDRFISSPFGDARENGRKHEGTDYSHSSREGTAPVPALEAGKVVEVFVPSNNHGYGYAVDIAGPSGIFRYAHLSSRPRLSAGDVIPAGATMGYEGTTGWTTGPCCHVERIVNGYRVDPLPAIHKIINSTNGTIGKDDDMIINITGKANVRAGGLYLFKGNERIFLGHAVAGFSGFPSIRNDEIVGKLFAQYPNAR